MHKKDYMNTNIWSYSFFIFCRKKIQFFLKDKYKKTQNDIQFLPSEFKFAFKKRSLWNKGYINFSCWFAESILISKRKSKIPINRNPKENMQDKDAGYILITGGYKNISGRVNQISIKNQQKKLGVMIQKHINYLQYQ